MRRAKPRRESDKAKARREHWRDVVRPSVLARDGGCVFFRSFTTVGRRYLVRIRCSRRYRLDPHHVEPRRRGGRDVPENLVTLCREHHEEAHRHPRVYRPQFVAYLASIGVAPYVSPKPWPKRQTRAADAGARDRTLLGGEP